MAVHSWELVIRKYGNSLVIPITKEMLKIGKYKAGDIVKVTIEKDD
ncbi:MAG: hypothetical protein QW203_06000 [Thermoplasmatales archaeon]